MTGLDLELIKRFKTILDVVCSSREVDHEKLGGYCRETAERLVGLYGWAQMTPTVHKLLMHTRIICEEAIVPIGMLSEEASEATNKYQRRFSSGRARQFSRKARNEDVFKRFDL